MNTAQTVYDKLNKGLISKVDIPKMPEFLEEDFDIKREDTATYIFKDGSFICFFEDGSYQLAAGRY